jgi:hypothetical protein
VARDRIAEIEKKVYENGKLMVKLVFAYAEVDRLSGLKQEGSLSPFKNSRS